MLWGTQSGLAHLLYDLPFNELPATYHPTYYLPIYLSRFYTMISFKTGIFACLAN